MEMLTSPSLQLHNRILTTFLGSAVIECALDQLVHFRGDQVYHQLANDETPLPSQAAKLKHTVIDGRNVQNPAGDESGSQKEREDFHTGTL